MTKSAHRSGVQAEIKEKQDFSKPSVFQSMPIEQINSIQGLMCFFQPFFSPKILHISVAVPIMFFLDISSDWNCWLTSAYSILLGRHDYQNYPIFFCPLVLVLTSREMEQVYSFLSMEEICCCECSGWFHAQFEYPHSDLLNMAQS